MDKLGKQLKYAELYAIYHDLLSSSRSSILDSYFNYDLSISEIADNLSISRAAVEDAIKVGTNKLDELEKTLGIAAKNKVIKDNINNIRESNGKNIEQYLTNIEKVIK